jgi:hypothetical protein
MGEVHFRFYSGKGKSIIYFQGSQVHYANRFGKSATKKY